MRPCPVPSCPSSWTYHTRTFESILAQALELILASWHACTAMLARLALAWGTAIALTDAPTAQEAVGEVQALPIHRHLWTQGSQELKREAQK